MAQMSSSASTSSSVFSSRLRCTRRPQDVSALFEVADSSNGHDQGVKRVGYAMAGIPALVIIDLGAREVAVYRTPVDGTYRQHDVPRPDDRLQVLGVAAANKGREFVRLSSHPRTTQPAARSWPFPHLTSLRTGPLRSRERKVQTEGEGVVSLAHDLPGQRS